MLAALGMLSPGAEKRPNFTGIWKLSQSRPAQFVLIDQSATRLRLLEFFGDHLGTFQAPIDGRPHPQTIEGRRCEFLARWEGDALFFETKQPAGEGGGVADVRHLARLGKDGMVLSVKRVSVTPRPATAMQKWMRQDAPAGAASDTGFDYRRRLEKTGAELSGEEAHRVRGAVACAFNDVAAAERELLPLVNQRPPSPYREEARQGLWETYVVNGMMKQALPYTTARNRGFYAELARRPEMQVRHRAPAHIRMTRDSEGRLLLPVSLGGKDAHYMMDTGSNNSLMKQSEAQRLGLKVERVRQWITDGNVNFASLLAVAPELTMGETRLANAPFWVVPDSRIEWPGVNAIIGLDILLKFETLRWNSDGEGETGFPGGEKNIHQANLCLWREYPLLEFSAYGKNQMALFLDTGNNLTQFYPSFAARNMELLADGGTRSVDEWHAHGAKGEFVQMTVPEIKLNVAGTDGRIAPANLLLEWPHLPRQFHGTLGVDMLNAAKSVTLDLKAMRLTAE